MRELLNVTVVNPEAAKDTWKIDLATDFRGLSLSHVATILLLICQEIEQTNGITAGTIFQEMLRMVFENEELPSPISH